MAGRGLAFDMSAAAVVAALAFGSAAFLQDRILPYKKQAPPSAAYMPGYRMLKIASFGFDKAAADAIWIHSIQYLHGEIIASGNEGRKAPMYFRMADVITDLDPDFRDAYYASGIFLSLLGRLSQAEEILGKARKRHPGTYFYHFQLGSLLYFDPRRDETDEEFDGRKARGVECFKTAMEAADCPDFEAEFMRRVLARTGHREAAFELLRRRFEREPDKFLREHWVEKMRQTVAEEWIDVVRTSLKSYFRLNGSHPDGLERLSVEPGRARILIRPAGRRGRFSVYETAPCGIQPIPDFSDMLLYDPASGEAHSAFLDGLLTRARRESVESAQGEFLLRSGRRASSIEELEKSGLLRHIGRPLAGSFALDDEGRLVVRGAGDE